MAAEGGRRRQKAVEGGKRRTGTTRPPFRPDGVDGVGWVPPGRVGQMWG
jgi:hypothetical protein